jgi:hypothetical protein
MIDEDAVVAPCPEASRAARDRARTLALVDARLVARGGSRLEDLDQVRQPQLRRSTTAAGVLGQADRGARFGRHDRRW